MIGVLVALALAVASPPKAYLDTGSARLPLSVVSWCWGAHCGAPFTASAKTAVLDRGATARVDFAFTPSSVHLAIGNTSTAVTRAGREISWRATHGGGVSLRVTGSGGWVNYVTRIRLR
jgi:hypothetical protein